MPNNPLPDWIATVALQFGWTPPASTTTPVTTTPTTTAPSTALPLGDVTTNGRSWKQTYAEDFNTDAAIGQVRTKYPKMGYYDGFGDTSGQGTYTPDKVLSVHDSVLDYYMHAENGKPLIANVMPDNYAPHRRARVSIRYKTTKTDGYKFVPLLWPSDPYVWNDGEIDWPEANLGSKPRPASAVPGSLSNNRMTFKPSTEVFAPTDTLDWHIATTEWDTGVVRFYWDGVLVAEVKDAVPTVPMRVTLQAETWIGQGAVPTGAAGHILVDWVAIWE